MAHGRESLVRVDLLLFRVHVVSKSVPDNSQIGDLMQPVLSMFLQESFQFPFNDCVNISKYLILYGKSMKIRSMSCQTHIKCGNSCIFRFPCLLLVNNPMRLVPRHKIGAGRKLKSPRPGNIRATRRDLLLLSLPTLANFGQNLVELQPEVGNCPACEISMQLQ